jgi:hypothetical protein
MASELRKKFEQEAQKSGAAAPSGGMFDLK